MTWITRGQPALVLAPMEGITDSLMRGFLSSKGAYSYCVTEFLRVSQEALPPKVVRREVPEVLADGRTRSGLPVQLQLLGGHAGRLAQTALGAVSVGVRAIDLNFGCPAPTVNRNDGGATLLKHPERLYEIVSTLRAALPAHIPLSCKLRLGWEDPSDILRNVEQVVRAGSSWITIHARTKVQGYKPPAHWHWIAEVKKRFDVPVVANGDVWSLEDFKRLQGESGCEHFMLGRGALFDPGLSHRIARNLGLPAQTGEEFSDAPQAWASLFSDYERFSLSQGLDSKSLAAKIKQWGSFARMKRSLPWFDEIKRLQTSEEILERLRALGGP